jgi:hypothetical protein
VAAPVAAVQFTQGATVGTAGQALFGVDGTAVVVANGNNTNVQAWTFTIIDVPPGSAVPTGVVQSGSSPTYTFTPDVTGGYHVQVTVAAADGTGVMVQDDRVFGVQTVTGRFVPPFKATDSAVNFAGQMRGWAPYMEGWLDPLDGVLQAFGATTPVATLTSGAAILSYPSFFFASTAAGAFTNVSIGVQQRSGTGANAGYKLFVLGQQGQDVASGTNNKGGAVRIGSGLAGTGGTGGLPGPVQLAIGDNLGAGSVMVEATEVVSGQRVVALCTTSALTSSEMPASTGDGVVYIANRQTAPMGANAVGGGILYAEAGALKWQGSSGTVTTLAAA